MNVVLDSPTNAPIGSSRRLARELPNATLHVSEASDHHVGRDRVDEITAVLAAAGT